MADSLSSVTGLASGIQWRDMVDQIMALEASRQLAPLQKSSSDATNRVMAWNTFTGLVGKLGEAAKKISGGAAFGTFKTAVGASPTSGRALLAASASQTAAPGTYQVEVLELARAEKLSGGVVASTGTALGAAGELLVNGKKITLAASDTLAQVRDKINAANTGASPSRVTATILSTGAGAHRLVLTSDQAGAAGIELVDGAGAPLVALGLLDGTTQANRTATGATQTNRFTTTETAIATMLGVQTFPAPATIKIGDKIVMVDLEHDTLASLQAKIAAAGAQASLATETTDGRSATRLVVDGAVSADTPDGQRALELLGMVEGGRGSVAQSLLGGRPLVDASGAAATAGTLLTDLGAAAGAPGLAGVQAGDTFTVRGTRADGTAVTLAYTVGDGDTVQTFLDRLNAPDAFGGGAKPATASLAADGRIRLTDGTAGDSQLSFSVIANNEGGGTLAFGATTVETVGRAREVAAGADARVRVDGVLVTKGSNTVTDALPGVTLNLQQAEAGTTVALTVTRDDEAVVGAIKEFAAAYNAITAFQKSQTDTKGPLAYNGSLRSAVQSMTNVMLTDVGGLGTLAFRRATQVGVSLSRTGQLEVDEKALKAALSTNLADVKALFSGSALSASATDLVPVTTSDRTLPGTYAVEITAAAAKAERTGAGFAGIYAGAGDTMTITDGFSGRSESIALTPGDSLATIIETLNAKFTAKGMSLVASDAGGQLAIGGTRYGSAASITVAYAGDGATDLGFPAGSYAGADVQGTIGGKVAKGTGDLLLANAGGATGLAVRYAGAATGAIGSVTNSLGVAQLMAARASVLTRTGDGLVPTQVESANDAIARLKTRQDDVARRLEQRRLAMLVRFQAMESAMSVVQSQSSWLSGQITALQGQNR